MDILSKIFGIYWVNIIGNIKGYIGLKLLNIFGKTLGYNGPLDILIKTMGYIWQNCGIYRQKLGDILWDIFVKSYGIYLTKIRDIFGKNYRIYLWRNTFQ